MLIYLQSSYIMGIAQQLKDKYNSDVPKTFAELNDLPGVGPKMASLTLSMAWNMYDQFLCCGVHN
jgi:endonuclease III